MIEFRSNFKKIIYSILGVVFLVLAYFGILLPGVPAIPFILLAAFCFTNSSEQLHKWMLQQKMIAKIHEKVNTKKGHWGFRLFVISQLWVSIIVAEFLFISDFFSGGILISGGIIFSVLINWLMIK